MFSFTGNGEDQDEHLAMAGSLRFLSTGIIHCASAVRDYIYGFGLLETFQRKQLQEILTHLVVLNEVNKRGPLHLHRLAVSVVERQDKVEKVGLAEVRGRLLLKMGPGQSDPTEDAERMRHSASSSKTSHTLSKIQLDIEGK